MNLAFASKKTEILKIIFLFHKIPRSDILIYRNAYAIIAIGKKK